MRPRRIRRTKLTSIVLLIASAAGTGTAAYAGGSDVHRTARHWHLITGTSHLVAGTPNCDTNTPPACVIPFTNQSAWEGDVAATQVQSGALVFPTPTSTAAVGTATSWITGTVLGCPAPGRVALAWTANGTNGWARVINGTGSGGLATVRGSFSYVTTFSTDGIPSTEYTGRLRCTDH